MPQFPKPLPLPESVIQARAARTRRMVRAAASGVGIRAAIIVGELVGYALLNSSVLLLDALHSLTDVAASLFVIVGIKLAERPPDASHPFGHGRYEPLAGLQLALLIALLGAGLMVQQIFAVAGHHEAAIDPRAWIIPLAAVVLLEIVYQVLARVARREGSPALAADAIHYRTDAISSVIATVALGAAAWFPDWSAKIDHLGAIVLAGSMVIMGLWAARANANQLLDRIPDAACFDRVRQAAAGVAGVLGVEKIRIQQSGPDAHVDIDIEVEPTMVVKDAHKITQQVRAAIQQDWPMVRDVIVHVEPYYANDH